MRQWVLYILIYPSICICQTVEQKYGDRIELLGVAFKDPLVLCQIFNAVFLIVAFLQSSVDKIFERNSDIKDIFLLNLFKASCGNSEYGTMCPKNIGTQGWQN